MTDFDNRTSRARRYAMLRTAMGPVIGAALEDPAVIEIMVNPDGALWLDRHGEGRVHAGAHYAFADPHLEGLRPAQKLLLRTGPRNQRALKRALRDFVLALSPAAGAA